VTISLTGRGESECVGQDSTTYVGELLLGLMHNLRGSAGSVRFPLHDPPRSGPTIRCGQLRRGLQVVPQVHEEGLPAGPN